MNGEIESHSFLPIALWNASVNIQSVEAIMEILTQPWSAEECPEFWNLEVRAGFLLHPKKSMIYCGLLILHVFRMPVVSEFK